MLFLRILKRIPFGLVAVYLKVPLMLIELYSKWLARGTKYFHSALLEYLFLKAKDVEIILSSIFAVIVLKSELNSEVILRLFVSILLLMCKILVCGLFVGFVLVNSFNSCHIYRPSFFVFFKEAFKVEIFAFS